MNLVHPGFHVHVVRGKVDLGQRVLKAGEEFEFEGLKLRFPEVHYWGEFRLVRDPGAPLLFLGFLVLGQRARARAVDRCVARIRRGRDGRNEGEGQDQGRRRQDQQTGPG